MALRNILAVIGLLVVLGCFRAVQATDITDNTCTFKVDGKIFTLALLNMNKAGEKGYYQTSYGNNRDIRFNFCEPFVPSGCTSQNSPTAYSYVLYTDNSQTTPTQPTDDNLVCTPFSSNSKVADFTPSYINNKGQIKLNLTMTTHFEVNQTQRSTIFLLDCEPDDTPYLTNIRVESLTDETLVIKGMSPYACPVFELSSLWTAF